MAERHGVGRDTVKADLACTGAAPVAGRHVQAVQRSRARRKLTDVVGLYLNPPERAFVFSFDEKTQRQALDRTQPSLPMKPGRGRRMTQNYKRNGTTDLCAALNVGTVEVLHDTRKTDTGADVVEFFKRIDLQVPRDLEVHVVLDNLSAHNSEPVRKWLSKPAQKRWHLHFTPTVRVWVKTAEEIIAKVQRGRRLTQQIKSATDH